MLASCNLSVEERAVAPETIPALVADLFTDEAAALLECTDSARLAPLGSLRLTEALPGCLRLVMAAPSVELRCERQAPAGAFACRILREQSGDACLVREDFLLLRNSARIAGVYRKEGRGRMASREYYVPVEDGMPVFYAERLAGVVTAHS